jgi:Tfp pilus assembly protein PilN
VIAGGMVAVGGKVCIRAGSPHRIEKNEILKKEIGKLDSQIADIMDLEVASSGWSRA